MIPLAQASVIPNRSGELPGASDLPRALLENIRTMDATATTESATGNHRSMEPLPTSAPEPAVATSNGRVMYDALTGMRFVAALVVFLVHFQGRFPVKFGVLGQLADISVGFFFLLSGFILTHVYQAGIPKNDRPRYVIARFARIWPVHAACLVLFLGLVLDNHLPDTGAGWLRLLAQFALVQSWATDQPTIIFYNGAAWSLSVEAFLYAVFPFLVTLDDRRFSRAYVAIACLTGLALVACEWIAANSPGHIEMVRTITRFSPPLRLLEFASGMEAARWLSRRRSRLVSGGPVRDTVVDFLAFGSIAVAFLLIGPNSLLRHAGWAADWRIVMSYLGMGMGYALPFAFLVTWFTRSRGLVAWAMSRRLAVALGEISFAFYMVHTPVQIVVLNSRLREVGDWRISFAVALIATLAASIALHLWVEKPSRELILGAWDKKLGAKWPGIRTQLLSLRGNAPALAATAVIALCPWFVSRTVANHRAIANASLFDATPPELRGVIFAEEARLLGAAGKLENGRLRLTVSYEPLPTAKRDLFVHVTDRDGKILLQWQATADATNHPGGRTVKTAEVSWDAAQLDGAKSVGIVFWKKEFSTARIDRGPTTMGGRRLEVFTIPSQIGAAGAGERHAKGPEPERNENGGGPGIRRDAPS